MLDLPKNDCALSLWFAKTVLEEADVIQIWFSRVPWRDERGERGGRGGRGEERGEGEGEREREREGRERGRGRGRGGEGGGEGERGREGERERVSESEWEWVRVSEWEWESVWERERERESESEREKVRECVCVCVREREREVIYWSIAIENAVFGKWWNMATYLNWEEGVRHQGFCQLKCLTRMYKTSHFRRARADTKPHSDGPRAKK